MAQVLEKAYLRFQNAEKNGEARMLQVQFNPAELKFSTSGMRKSGKKGFNRKKKKPSEAERTCGSLKEANLSARLVFDAGEEAWEGSGRDVERIVQGLIGAVRRNAQDTNTAFCWGTLAFEGVLESISAEYVMFDRDGKPLRANVDLEIRGVYQKD